MNCAGCLKSFDLSTGRGVFLCFALFFVLVAAVNAVFIYVALGSHSGVVTEHAYKEGLAYDQRLQRAQSLPHYESALRYEDGFLRLHLRDDAGVEASGLVIIGKMIRPVVQGSDFDIVMKPVGAGVYESDLGDIQKGLWKVHLKGQVGDKIYLYTQQIVIP